MSLQAYGEGAVALANVLEAQRNAREILARYIEDLAAADAALRALRWLTTLRRRDETGGVALPRAGWRGVWGGGDAGDRNAQNVSREPGVLGVSTSVATTRPFPHVVSAIGTVTPRPDRFAALAPPGRRAWRGSWWSRGSPSPRVSR